MSDETPTRLAGEATRAFLARVLVDEGAPAWMVTLDVPTRSDGGGTNVADLQPRPVTDEDCQGWHGERLVLGPNAQGIGTQLEVVLTESIDEGTDQVVPHVCIPFALDEISLARLAQGGTLWVCVLGTSTVPLFVATQTDYGPSGDEK